MHQEAAAILRSLAWPEGPSEAPDEQNHGWHDARTKSGIDYWNLARLIEVGVESAGASIDLHMWQAMGDVIAANLQHRPSSMPYIDSTWVSRSDWDDEDRGYESPIHILLRGMYRESLRLIAAGHDPRTLVHLLFGRRWSAFRRLAMRLMADQPDALRDDAVAIILDRDQFVDDSVRKDYAKLLQDVAQHMSDSERLAYCEMVETEISHNDVRRRLEEVFPTEAFSEDGIQEQVSRERSARLAPLSGHLPPDWQRMLDKSIDQHGQPHFVYGPVEFGTGPAFVPSRNLSDLTSEQILAALKEATPEPLEESFNLGSYDLYRGLEDEVIRRPETLLTSSFLDRTPTHYRAALLAGARAAVTSGADVLKATLGVASRAVDARGAKEEVYLAACRAVEASAQRQDAPREVVLSCIDLLEQIGRVAATPECTIWDACDVCLNRARTRALEVLIDIQGRAKQEVPLHSFAFEPANAAMHEIVGEWPRAAPCLAAALGQRLVNLWVIDKEWLLTSTDVHLRSTDEDCWKAAWVAYVTWNRAYTEIISEFEQEYLRGLMWTLALEADPHQRHGSDYMEGVGRHYAVIWYRGIGSPELRTAIRAAPNQVAAAIVRELAAGLEATRPGDSKELVNRVEELIHAYIRRLIDGDLAASSFVSIDRIIASSGHFSPATRMGWLVYSLRSRVSLHADEDLLNACLSSTATAPDQASEALSLLVDELPFYVLRDLAGALLDRLGQLAPAANASQRMNLATACDILVRRGFAQFEPLFYTLSA